MKGSDISSHLFFKTGLEGGSERKHFSQPGYGQKEVGQLLAGDVTRYFQVSLLCLPFLPIPFSSVQPQTFFSP